MQRQKRVKPQITSRSLEDLNPYKYCTLEFIDTYIGYGVFARETIHKGELILEYKGTLSCADKCRDENSWRFYFKHDNQTFCVDATETDCIGKMVNDELPRKANCKMKKLIVDGKPRLCLFSQRNIAIGEQLNYDYGVSDLPWRKLKKGDVKPVLYEKPKLFTLEDEASTDENVTPGDVVGATPTTLTCREDEAAADATCSASKEDDAFEHSTEDAGAFGGFTREITDKANNSETGDITKDPGVFQEGDEMKQVTKSFDVIQADDEMQEVTKAPDGIQEYNQMQHITKVPDGMKEDDQNHQVTKVPDGTQEDDQMQQGTKVHDSSQIDDQVQQVTQVPDGTEEDDQVQQITEVPDGMKEDDQMQQGTKVHDSSQIDDQVQQVTQVPDGTEEDDQVQQITEVPDGMKEGDQMQQVTKVANCTQEDDQMQKVTKVPDGFQKDDQMQQVTTDPDGAQEDDNMEQVTKVPDGTQEDDEMQQVTKVPDGIQEDDQMQQVPDGTNLHEQMPQVSKVPDCMKEDDQMQQVTKVPGGIQDNDQMQQVKDGFQGADQMQQVTKIPDGTPENEQMQQFMEVHDGTQKDNQMQQVTIIFVGTQKDAQMQQVTKSPDGTQEDEQMQQDTKVPDGIQRDDQMQQVTKVPDGTQEDDQMQQVTKVPDGTQEDYQMQQVTEVPDGTQEDYQLEQISKVADGTQEDDQMQQVTKVPDGTQEDDQMQQVTKVPDGTQEDDEMQQVTEVPDGTQEHEQVQRVTEVSDGTQEDDQLEQISKVADGTQEDDQMQRVTEVADGTQEDNQLQEVTKVSDVMKEDDQMQQVTKVPDGIQEDDQMLQGTKVPDGFQEDDEMQQVAKVPVCTQEDAHMQQVKEVPDSTQEDDQMRQVTKIPVGTREDDKMQQVTKVPDGFQDHDDVNDEIGSDWKMEDTDASKEIAGAKPGCEREEMIVEEEREEIIVEEDFGTFFHPVTNLFPGVMPSCEREEKMVEEDSGNNIEQPLQTNTEKTYLAEKLRQSDSETDSQINVHIQNEWDLDDRSDILDDSFNDPDFKPNDSNYDGTSEEDGSMDEEFPVCKLNRKRLAELDDNSLLHKRQKTGSEKTTVDSFDSDFVSDSNDSCESKIIPGIPPQLISQESGKMTDEAHCDSTSHPDDITTNQTSKSPPFSFTSSDTHKFNTVRFGLLPKQPKKSGCKQVYDKVNYCTYCKKAVKSKISRHLLAVHKSYSRVYDILTLPKRSKERMVKLEILANEGNFKHNVEVLRSKVGFLAVGRRENQERNYKVGSYLPCDFCKKFILKETLWLHHKTCSVKHFMNKSNENELKGNAVRLSRQLLNSAVLEETNEGMSKLLSRMNEDEVTEVVKHDDLIKRYAVLKVESLGRQQDQKINDMHKVSQSCRTLARLVIKCREKSEHMIDMNRLVSPSNFDLVINATKSMCLETKNEKAAPSLGKLVGNNLAHIIQVKKGASLRNDDNKGLQEAENFQRLFKAEWNCRINSVFQKMTNTINRQKVKTIPLTEDLQKLRNYILISMQNESASLEKKPCSITWARLARLTLCRLILFNKRRRAEVKDLKLAEYETRPNWKKEQQGEFRMALSTSARMLAERMDMVISAGKSLKNVDAYVIMPPDAKNAVTLLNRTRHEVGVSTSNPYIFARLNCDSPLSGNSDLREIVAECPGLQHPGRITSTGLRRYIATVSQILDMSDSELESLARHLGHDVQTHKQNYRLSHATRELTVVSQLLIAVDNGMVNKWKGKRLSEISVDELPDVPEDDMEENADEDCNPVDVGATQSLSKSDENASHLRSSPLCAEVRMDIHPKDCNPVDVGATQSMSKSDENASHVRSSPLSAEVRKDIHPKGKCSKKPWSKSVEEFLKKTFKYYINGTRSSVHNSDMILAQNTCLELSTRTLPQIRAKLNNMKLGKSK